MYMYTYIYVYIYVWIYLEICIHRFLCGNVYVYILYMCMHVYLLIQRLFDCAGQAHFAKSQPKKNAEHRRAKRCLSRQ